MNKPVPATRETTSWRRTAAAPGRRGQDEDPSLEVTFVRADLDVARAVFRKDNRIARVLGVDPAQLSRWGRGQIPAPENQAMLHALAETVRTLSESYDVSVIPGWFNAPRAGEERSPAEMLREGRYDELMETVEASVQGAFS